MAGRILFIIQQSNNGGLEDVCDACHNDRVARKSCDFCNGTGEYNPAADAMMNRPYGHPCQCMFSADGCKTCQLCSQKCHHRESQNMPRIEVSPSM